jgi:hypothetical protein
MFAIKIDENTFSEIDLASVNFTENPPLNPYKLYFQYNSKNSFKNLNCIENDQYVHLTWENLFYLGTIDQRIKFNDLRLRYVAALKSILIHTCQSPQCQIVGVGTSENISPASDIDMNILIKEDKSRDLSSIILKLETLFSNINTYHIRWFKDPYHEIFDLNFYATKFDYDVNITGSSLKSDCNQTKWAILRAVEVIEPLALTDENTQYLTKTKVYRLGLQLYNKKKKDENKNTYVTKIGQYLQSENTEYRVDKFSESKYLERETYRSVGAYLHIVEKHRNLDKSFYVDSILDNYGFLIENLLHTTKCADIAIELKLQRVCKYLERICDALILYYNVLDKKYFENEINSYTTLKNSAEKINQLRKKFNSEIPNEEYVNLYNSFPIKPYFNLKNEWDWFRIITINCISILPDDPKCHEGGYTTKPRKKKTRGLG